MKLFESLRNLKINVFDVRDMQELIDLNILSKEERTMIEYLQMKYPEDIIGIKDRFFCFNNLKIMSMRQFFDLFYKDDGRGKTKLILRNKCDIAKWNSERMHKK